MFSKTITSAQQYANAGMGEEWVRTYLSSMDKEMPDISDYFMTELVKIPLRLIDADDACAEATDSAFDVPLIVVFDNKKFTTPFQPGYLQNLKKEKQNSQYAFVFAGNDEYSYFWNNFGKNFQR